MEIFKEKAVGCSLVAGIFLMTVGAFLVWVFSVAGIYRGTYTREPGTNAIRDAGTLNLVPLTILVIVVGLVLALGAVLYGVLSNARSNTGPRKSFENARVVGRYGYSKTGQMLNADWEFDGAEDPRYYVRLQLVNGEVAEFECSREVFYQAGEGMYGQADVQGKWIGKFTPYIGVAPTN